MMLPSINILLYLLLCLNRARFLASFSDFYFELFEFKGASKLPIYGNVSMKRTGNDHPKLFGDLEVTDAARNYDIELKIYYSHLGNRQFILMPYKFPRLPICDTLKNDYVVKIFRNMQNCSNVPASEDPNVEICDLISLGHYYLRNCDIDPSTFPDTMPTGRLRFETYIYRRAENEILQTLLWQIHVT